MREEVWIGQTDRWLPGWMVSLLFHGNLFWDVSALFFSPNTRRITFPSHQLVRRVGLVKDEGSQAKKLNKEVGVYIFSSFKRRRRKKKRSKKVPGLAKGIPLKPTKLTGHHETDSVTKPRTNTQSKNYQDGGARYFPE